MDRGGSPLGPGWRALHFEPRPYYTSIWLTCTSINFNYIYIFQLCMLQRSRLDRILSCLHAKGNSWSRSPLLSKLQVEGEDEENAKSKAIFVNQSRIDEGTLEVLHANCMLLAAPSCASSNFWANKRCSWSSQMQRQFERCEFQALQAIFLPTSSKRCRSSSSFCLERLGKTRFTKR